MTGVFNPMIAEAGSYYESSETISQSNNNLSPSEQEKLARIMEELAYIREEVQININLYNNYQNKNNSIPIDSSQENMVATPPEVKSNLEMTNSNDEQRYNIFNEYSGYYRLDTTVVYNLAKTLTSNFSEEAYLSNYFIGNTTFYNKKRVYPNEEAGIIAFVRCLTLSPENYGISINYIKTGVYSEYSGLYEQMTAKISDLLGINKVTMLAIMYHETGYFNSEPFIYKNNPAGIMPESGILKSFDNKEAGIIEAIYNVYFRFYENNNILV